MDEEIEEKEKLKSDVYDTEQEVKDVKESAKVPKDDVEDQKENAEDDPEVLEEEIEVVEDSGVNNEKQEEDVNDKTKAVEDLFADSTVRFLWAKTLETNGQGRRLHLFDKLVAIAVVLVQAGLYGYLFRDAIDKFAEDQVTVTVNSEDCRTKTFGDDFGCDVAESSLKINVMAVLLFLAFTASDIGGAFRLILTGGFWQKIAGILLLVESFVATLCCAAMALLGGLESASGSMLAAVGVSFIHELDEKVRSVYEFCPNFKQVFVLSIWSIITAVGSLVATLMFANWQQEVNVSVEVAADPT